MQRKGPGHPPRLDQVYQGYEPFWFITCCTRNRLALLNNEDCHQAFIAYAEKNAAQGRCIGRYVLMPDHMHFFVHTGASSLGRFVGLLKQSLTQSMGKSEVWQRGFFDHLLRHSESHEEKWQYVRLNPVRAGLVQNAEDWPYQGEIVRIQM